MNNLLVKDDIDCPIHVDAASGGFVAPFVVPSLKWDFRLEKVVSINVSGHKYGLVWLQQTVVPLYSLISCRSIQEWAGPSGDHQSISHRS